jgi:hypothetical protein
MNDAGYLLTGILIGCVISGTFIGLVAQGSGLNDGHIESLNKYDPCLKGQFRQTTIESSHYLCNDGKWASFRVSTNN